MFGNVTLSLKSSPAQTVWAEEIHAGRFGIDEEVFWG